MLKWATRKNTYSNLIWHFRRKYLLHVVTVISDRRKLKALTWSVCNRESAQKLQLQLTNFIRSINVPSTGAVDMIDMMRRKSKFARVWIQYKTLKCMHTQGSSVEIQAQTHRKLLGRSPTAEWPVSSPSSSLSVPWSHHELIPANLKFGTRFKNIVIAVVYSFKEYLSLKSRNLMLPKWGRVCMLKWGWVEWQPCKCERIETRLCADVGTESHHRWL
jgi:hypothetical protein